MHRRRLPLLALGSFLLAGLASAAPAKSASDTTPLLRGILIDGSGNLFSLADAAGSATWVKLGQTFEGWRLESFDADKRILTVSRDGATRELALENATIQADDTKAGFAEADALLDQMRFEDLISKSLESQQKAMAKAMTQMAGKNMSPDAAAKMAEMQAKAMKIMLEEMDIPGMKKELAQAMTEIYTPAEIRAQAAFYSTAAGQATIEKQPRLQARMSELMMPRMMRAMPKIQAAMAAEAKAAAPGGSSPAPAPAAP